MWAHFHVDFYYVTAAPLWAGPCWVTLFKRTYFCPVLRTLTFTQVKLRRLLVLFSRSVVCLSSRLLPQTWNRASSCCFLNSDLVWVLSRLLEMKPLPHLTVHSDAAVVSSTRQHACSFDLFCLLLHRPEWNLSGQASVKPVGHNLLLQLYSWGRKGTSSSFIHTAGHPQTNRVSLWGNQMQGSNNPISKPLKYFLITLKYVSNEQQRMNSLF